MKLAQRMIFSLPIPEVMINNTYGFERMSFMDCFSGYNQIKMHSEDENHMSFRTPSRSIATLSSHLV